MESYGKVAYQKVADALAQVAYNAGNNLNEVELSFEYLVGSFFPEVMANITATMKDTYTQGYIAGYRDKNIRYPVVTLCGSTKFKDEFLRVQKELTLKGYIVISLGVFGHSGDDEVYENGVKSMLDDMHRNKIDLADEIYVINVGGYIGHSTAAEIEYAKSQGKKICYLEEPQK